MTKPELELLWLRALEEVVNLAAHEVKDALNGVSLNLEVIRSRASASGEPRGARELAAFAEAAADQLERVTDRTEAVLFLSRPPREPADVAATLKHLAALIGPAILGEGGTFRLDLAASSCQTRASGQATRLAVTAGALALVKASETAGGEGLARCSLDPAPEPVVRFSHESAARCSLETAIAQALADHSIRCETEGADLVLVFPR